MLMAPMKERKSRHKRSTMGPIFLTICILSLFLKENNVIATEAPPSLKPQDKCEKLKKSLTYTQEAAPRDISAVLRVVVEKVNRDVEGVVDVEVGWTGGELHRVVGDHLVQCSVTRLLSSVKTERLIPEEDVQTDEHGRDVTIQCFHVPFTILDTDECALEKGHPMQHKCQEPSFCVNTVGSYECVCPTDDDDGTGGVEGAAAESDYWVKLLSQKRSPWELSPNSTTETSCPNQPSTHNCCAKNAHTSDGVTCRAAFRCPVDPCGAKGSAEGLNDCAQNAHCRRTKSPLSLPSYNCQCPSGLMGNGHKCKKGIDTKPEPKVRYDGITPTAETLKNNYCGCTKPVVDACAGFPKCAGKHEVCTVTSANTPECGCKPGFVKISGYGCVDETPPVLKLRHDPDGNGVNRLKQGDRYEEHAVDIIDDNAEDYLRSLKITYSHPLPPGCLSKMGEFHVNYTVATPWTSPPYVRVTRNVIIEDINECELDVDKYETACPKLLPMCDTDAGAVCRNTEGSYTCQCPQYTTGDGFKQIDLVQRDTAGKFIDAPKGYSGGKGCKDTSKPVIEVLGPNPKVLKVCRAGGLKGIMGGGTDDEDPEIQELVEDQRRRYTNDIKSMIKSSRGAELCATHTQPNPRPADCVRATDHTYKGPVNLSSRVTVGEPEQKGVLEWRVPYTVSDDAGNDAKTVWRNVAVEEVCLSDLERKIRDGVLADKEREINEAVKKALHLERKKVKATESALLAGTASSKQQQKACPKCQQCVCDNKQKGLTTQECDAICDKRIMAEATTTCPSASSSASTSGSNVNKGAGPSAQNSFSFSDLLHTPGMIALFLLAVMGVIFMISAARVALSGFNFGDSYRYTQEEEERERTMMNAVRYYNSPEPAMHRGPSMGPGTPASVQARSASPAPPRSNMFGGGAVGNGIFSPQENRMYRQQGFSPGGGGRRDDDGGIYQTMSPITPMRSNGSPAVHPGSARSAPYMR
uniref:EGF-like domain-containing protein n=2 Tax=Ditylum brightwellii TaxID=49249 RepID=A0A7S1ZAU1_9STRA|mmetsp:Transcript_2792/g.4284  ORF Transcript_2792/g.4284 Transcript_2792/m.4284 type:complete len:977 (+) Transcript_2792:86-3016(+)